MLKGWPHDRLAPENLRSAIGWVTLIRSIILLFLSPEAIRRFVKAVRYEQNYYLFTAIPLLVGLYLTVAGLASRWE